MRKYYVVTVHYGEEAITKTLIEQLLSGQTQPQAIVVIDHAEKALVPPPSWKETGVSVVRPSENTGYGAGVNLGLGVLMGKNVSRSDVVVALNNDTTLQPDSLSRLQQWWEKNTDTPVAGSKYGHVDLLTGRSHISPRPNSRSRYLPYLHGSLLVAPLDTFLRLQGLPNQFFLYWEDVLFSQRARSLGISLQVIPDVGITHNDSLSTPSPDHLYYLVRNGAIFLSRHSPRPWRYAWRLANYARLVYHTLHKSAPNTPVIREALHDAVRMKRGKRL